MFRKRTILFLLLISVYFGVIKSLEEDTNEDDTKSTERNKKHDPMSFVVGSSHKHKNTYKRSTSYVLTETKLAQMRKKLMYPYKDKGGHDGVGDFQKDIHNASPLVYKNLKFNLPFFGFRYNYTKVSLNGYLEFSDSPEYRSSDYPLVFPTKEWPKIKDPSFIGIFYSKCRIGRLKETETGKTPGVYFRIEKDLRARTDKTGVELRERLKWDVREGIVGAETFSPKHSIVVTWQNVSFAGGIDTSLYKTNTFQMVLTTDEVYTYVIFNYQHLDWFSHTEAGGDTLTGQGGVPAFIGFNAGNGSGSYEYKPYSQESFIKKVVSSGWGNGLKGRHIFRIDEKILRGSCNKDLMNERNELFEFAPESGNMLGGTVVNISGPCFRPDDTISCTFHRSPVVGYVVNKNLAICVQPRLYVHGWIDLSISTSAVPFPYEGKYFVESPSAASKIWFNDLSPFERSPSEISFVWNNQNLTMNRDETVRISLWGYKETIEGPMVTYIDELASDVPNTGQIKIPQSRYKTKNDAASNWIKFGFIQINLTNPIKIDLHGSTKKTAEINRNIWSQPIPLGWYFHDQWNETYGDQWATEICKNWLTTDRLYDDFAQDLPECPCTLEQALADKGRYLSDKSCDKDINPSCIHHKGAIHCVTSGFPTSEGAEQQCCYDRNGYLMLSFDQPWGSTPKRFHSSAPIPTLSQWNHDIMPKYACCLWQDSNSDGCESLRYERRPSQNCIGYKSPGIAGVYGSLHFITFDDLEYTFNGLGEFVLLKSTIPSNDLDIQGRFEQLPDNAYGEVKATRLTSIVARGNDSVIVEVKQRPAEAKWRYSLDVIVDNRRLYFDNVALKRQQFKGVLVYVPSYIFNQSEVVLMFDNGVGIEVVDNEGFMSARVFLPESLQNSTAGLLGNWNLDMHDDWTLPDGSTIQVSKDKNLAYIHNMFGSLWMIDDHSDLFHRFYGKSAANYNNKSFKPVLFLAPEDILPPNRTITVIRAYDLCSTGMAECYYDYVMTLNRKAAYYSMFYKNEIYLLQETTRKKIISCGVLKAPRFGIKSTFLFVPGTIVKFECLNDFVLIGDKRRICQANGSWNTPSYGYTECVH